MLEASHPLSVQELSARAWSRAAAVRGGVDMRDKASDKRRHEMRIVGADTPVRREIEDMLHGRMWIRPEQVRVAVRDGVATLTGAVDRRSTAGIAARLTTGVPGVRQVVDQIRFDFDDTDLLVRSEVSRTHPFTPIRSRRPAHAGG
jgi:osmotically-inducible protein OsmY